MRHVQRRHLSRARWSLPALLLLGACSSPTEPSDVRLAFFTKVVFGLPTLATIATPGAGTIEVEGVLLAPHTSYDLSGDATPAVGRLDVAITARKAGTGLPYPTQNYYAVTLSSLRRGDYAVRVMHVVEREQMDTTVVFNKTVTVR
jgi:hypothetical protein